MSEDKTEKPKSNFVHIHTHSHYSMLDGMGKINELVKKAADLGMPALALTDHGVMHGVVEFYEECEKAGIKPLIGCEVYVAPRTLKDKVPRIDASPYHLILIAKDMEGYKNLLKLTTVAHLEGYYYKPRVDKELLKKHSKGLIASTACVQGEVPRKGLEDIEKGREAIREMIEIFGKDNLYLEVQYHKTVDVQDASNQLIFRYAKEFDLKVIATNDIHYVNSSDAEAQDALICLQTSRYMDETDRMTMMGDDYSLLSEEEMAKNFPNHPEVITNTLEIAEKCNLKLDLGGIIIPDFPVPDGHTLHSYFLECCYLGLNMRYGEDKIAKQDLPKDREPTAKELKISEDVWDRFKYEAEVIQKMGYEGYLLIVADFIVWSKEHEVSVGPGRGSGAGSIILYALRITELNPLDYDLLFERFLNPDRISMPDIDTDFADSRRNKVIEYVSKKYGRDHVAQIITFGTMAARMAVRDVGRVLSMSYTEVDTIAKLIPAGQSLEEAIKNINELKEVYNADAKVKRCIDIAKRLEGVVRHASMHAAGVVISKDPLTEYCPLQAAAKGDLSTVTQYSMNPIEHLGLLKFDFLGLANLTIIQDALRIIRKTKDTDLNIDALPLDDKATYKLLSEGRTTGVFQLESDGMKRYLKELKPSVFEDIIAMVALYRPGPMQWIQSFIDRKHGREKIKYVHPKAEEALKNTYGIMVYQEQVMQLSKDMAGFTGGQADTLRKAIGKKIKELMVKVGKEFVEGCVKNGIDKAIADELYNAMQDFAQYCFNKSHAACYGLIAYQTAYLKAHYPSEFMAALMTSEKDDLDKLAVCIQECEDIKIKVLPPNVNESFVDFGVVRESGNIRFGLSAIKNVGVAVAEEIVEERKRGGKFSDIGDLLKRLGPKVINKKSLEALSMAGALDDMGERAELIFNMEKMLAYASNMQKNQNSGQSSLFGGEEELSTNQIEFEATKPADKKQRLAWERELLGMYVSEHPLTGISHLIEPHRTVKLSEINTHMENEFVRVSGIFTSVQNIMTRSNQKMAFARMEDLGGNIEVLAFPKVLAENPDIFTPDKVVAVDGYINFKDGSAKILAEAVYEIGQQLTIPDFEKRAKKKQWGGNKYETNSNNQNSNGKRELYLDKKEPREVILQTLIVTIEKGADKSLFSNLKQLLSEFPGNSPVIINVPNNGHGYKEIKTKTRVDICPVLRAKLKELVGNKNIETK
ncbi:MAG: DNA polymerase III subunit alpha [bacterium ADurb.Bin212]|nr:MAG: DNA polymerase III subunit alpha [bacterium ADurb.Bin212]